MNVSSMNVPSMNVSSMNVSSMLPQTQNTGLTPARQANPSLLAYAQRVFGSVDLDEGQWKQCEDQLKVETKFNFTNLINYLLDGCPVC